jgi:hypothetical protein
VGQRAVRDTKETQKTEEKFSSPSGKVTEQKKIRLKYSRMKGKELNDYKSNWGNLEKCGPRLMHTRRCLELARLRES